MQLKRCKLLRTGWRFVEFLPLMSCRTYSDRIQESPTLDLANDCSRFVTVYFEVISASAPHIYHSALVVAPQKSIVRKLYGSHAHPFVRVVRGAPMSWDENTAATSPFEIELVVWSPCNRFIAIIFQDSMTVDVLDSATLQRLQTLEFPEGISGMHRALIFSPDSRILTCSSDGITRYFEPDRELSVVSWDLQTGGIASAIRWQGPEQSFAEDPSITYSANGKMVGVLYRHGGHHNTANIFICDVTSGVYMHFHSLNVDCILLLDNTRTTENPCGSYLLVRRPLPSGKLGSLWVPHPRRSRPFLSQTTLTPRGVIKCT